uniref:Ig-like domain-containing protein n=1 Tax=Tetraodon nigroviridis TaxID=99883 RepID=H3CH82_TETNG
KSEFLLFFFVYIYRLKFSLTVEAEQNWYWSEFGGDVVMGCRFQAGVPPSNLTVTWHWISSTSIREAYRLENGLEHPDTQDPVYRDRATLLREELKDGWAKLKISELRIGDSGTYQCLVRAGIEADYKEIHLTVRAPYKTVTKHLQRVEGGDEALLTCQSEGLPKSSVQWLDGHGRPLNASTTATVTPQQLIRVTSRIQVRFHDDSNYTCSFDGGVSATFVLREQLLAPPPANTKAPLIAVGVVVGAVLVMAVFLWQRRRKGNRHTCARSEVGGVSAAKQRPRVAARR